MPSKYARRPPTHSIVPVCIAPPKQPGVRTAPFPRFLRIQVIFEPHAAPGLPTRTSFYFNNFPINVAGQGSQDTSNGGYTCHVYAEFTDSGRKLAISAHAFQTGPIAAWLETAPTTLTPANPIEQTWTAYSNAQPPGQTGRTKCWE